MPNIPAPLTQEITWRPIDSRCTYLPADEAPVLIYDGWLDDVVMGWIEYPEGWQLGGDKPLLWIDGNTGYQLKDPRLWTDKPMPGKEQL
jgi:hypothetical protein